jgi:CelD/BcsL family acetyltransferase involved in cellulose biosynthesis
MRPGFLLQTDPESSGRALVAELFASLDRGEADAVSFYGLEPGSPVYRDATELPSLICRGRFVVRERHWTLELPDSLDAFLRSRSRRGRGELRAVDNRVARKYGPRMSVRLFRSPDELDRLFVDLERVAAKTYQRALDVAFADTAEHRDTIALALDRGWFRAYVLYLDGEPIAYRSGFLYRGRFSGSETGYDPAFSRDRVGTYLLLRLIDDLCRDDAADILDFGCGEAEHKRRFSTAGSEEAHPFVFAPTFTGVRVNAVRTAIAAADELGRRTLDRAGLATAIRKRWRSEQTAGSTS